MDHEHAWGKDFLISVDIESTGPIPWIYSMWDAGASPVLDNSQRFEVAIELLNNNFVPKALAACHVTLEGLKARPNQVPPQEAMKRFAEWIKRVTPPGMRPVFVAEGACFDWMFVAWYFEVFYGENPFGFNGLDIKSYYMGMRACMWSQTGRRNDEFPSRYPHPHRGLGDSLEQGEKFKRMLIVNAQMKTLE